MAQAQVQQLPVVVIGAGIAGLYCGELLSNAGIPVVVVEGAPFIGFVDNLSATVSSWSGIFWVV
jgi:flavin-dependent dehydrogenase